MHDVDVARPSELRYDEMRDDQGQEERAVVVSRLLRASLLVASFGGEGWLVDNGLL